MAIQLDEIDVRLLRELELDADRPNVELARIVGLSPAATLNRVRRLKESGVITKLVDDVLDGAGGRAERNDRALASSSRYASTAPYRRPETSSNSAATSRGPRARVSTAAACWRRSSK